MSCVLRAGGMEFDPEAYLADSPFSNVVRHRRGTYGSSGRAGGRGTSHDGLCALRRVTREGGDGSKREDDIALMNLGG